MSVIVWIEDETALIDAVVRPLELKGHEVVRICDAREALENLEAIRRADVLLLDMILPGAAAEEDSTDHEGLRLLRELQSEFSVGTPVIVFSVLDTRVMAETLANLGVVDIISKPVLPSELCRRVEHALGVLPSEQHENGSIRAPQ